MAIGTIGRASVGLTEVAATAVTGWSSTTPCFTGVVVSLPSDATGKMYYGYATGVTTANGMRIPNGVPFTISAAELSAGGSRPSLSNLFFISDTAAQVFTATAIG